MQTYINKSKTQKQYNAQADHQIPTSVIRPNNIFFAVKEALQAKKAAAQRQGDFSTFSLESGISPEQFRSQKYELPNFKPSTGGGLFDVKYNPYNGRLEVKMKINFQFLAGSILDFPTAKASDLIWDKTQQDAWKKSISK
ncbi:MAG: hypothetical protein HC880_20650 [Bacteroidia bacterium]|nr:hypothetical protein [Bacteroidia bacterium]